MALERELNILTWNIDWFRNGQRSNGPSKYRIEDIQKDVMEEIVAFLRGFLEKENPLILLNEMPYRHRGNNWEPLPIREEFFAFFNSCCDIHVQHNGYLLRDTIAISPKGLFDQPLIESDVARAIRKDNRFVELCFRGVRILGVHMPTYDPSRDRASEIRRAKECWENLSSYSGEADNMIIAGDFNAFVGCKNAFVDGAFRKLCDDYYDVIPAGSTTYRSGGTCIDHILLGSGIDCDFRCVVHQDVRLSDHVPVSLSVKLS